MANAKCPCFDPSTKTDCPDRRARCAVECPKWADYVRDRNGMYDKIHAVKSGLNPVTEAFEGRVTKSLKQKIHDARYKKGGIE